MIVKKFPHFFEKVFWILPLGIVVLLFFQNCSNVNLANQDSSASSGVFVSGKLCYPGSARDSSLYKLADLYVINLNARYENGVLKADSDMNSVVDSAEKILNKDGSLTTILINNKDSDNDGVPDFIEKLKGFNANKDEMGVDGYDGDGVTNKQELLRGSDPLSYDPEVKNTEYTVTLASNQESSDCGSGQLVYSFDVSSIKLASVTSFTDGVSSKNSPFFLSHTEDENLILIMYKLRSENINNPDMLYGHLLKLKIGEPVSYVLSPKDFSLIPN